MASVTSPVQPLGMGSPLKSWSRENSKQPSECQSYDARNPKKNRLSTSLTRPFGSRPNHFCSQYRYHCTKMQSQIPTRVSETILPVQSQHKPRSYQSPSQTSNPVTPKVGLGTGYKGTVGLGSEYKGTVGAGYPGGGMQTSICVLLLNSGHCGGTASPTSLW